MSTTDPFADPEPLLARLDAFVAYRLGEGPEAEDVVGETVERALRYRSSYDPRRGPPIAWLIGIARRVLADRPPPLLAAAPEVDPPAAGDLADDAALRVTVWSAVSRLSARDRELVALRYGADLTTRQIAAILELRPNTVDVALRRALDRLRALLEEREVEPVERGVSFRRASR